MKNNFLILLLIFIVNSKLCAEDIFIEAKNITLNKERKTTIFKNNVIAKTKNTKIKSEFAEYNKVTQEIILKNNIIANDKLNNEIKTNFAEYNNINKLFKTIGPTTLLTAENYFLEGSDIFFDNKKKIIKSSKKSTLKDLSGNKIYLENFEYLAKENIFKSVGFIKIVDKLQNSYEFSQIYIDTKKKEVFGTDIKAFLNHSDFKQNEKNDPRVFANTLKLNDKESSFNKSIFTLCELKPNQKCPPWTLRASKMTHDNVSKTIYYDNATIKFFDIPIFYFPYLSHPDTSVERRSGLLPPAFSDFKNLGAGVSIPYFWAISDDKNFVIKPKLFVSENPLITGEYHQALKNSNFFADFGFTEGYKKTSETKKSGNKSHFFSKFTKDFLGKFDSENNLNIKTQRVSNDKYLKLYKIKTELVDYEEDTLENTFNFTHTKDDFFFNLNTSVYETLKEEYNDKYEYILPDITIDQNILSNKNFGNVDLQTNYKVHNYDTNRFKNFFVNDFEWKSNDIITNSFIKNRFLGNIKNINYEVKNVYPFKETTTTELFGSIGLLSEIDFQKKINDSNHLITPKLLLRLSPGSMRKEESGFILTPTDAFNIERLNTNDNFETGNNASIGFDYTFKKNNINKFNFSVAQIINEKENKKMNQQTSLDEKLSDLVGNANYNLSENLNLTHKFSIDQNYKEINYNDFGSSFKFGNMGLDFNYIMEDKHIGNQEYFKTKIEYNNINKNLIKIETKRNLIKNSSEYYDLSYEYINDCLRAGLVYRREFYNDSELEADNSLMFNITLVPFGTLDSPKFNK